MHIMTAEALDTSPVHDALNKIVALHPILMSGAVGKMRKTRLTEFVLLELPEILQIETHVKTHRPVVVSARYRVLQRAPL
jgi:hypothetical protein